MNRKLERYSIPIQPHTGHFGAALAFHAIPDAMVALHLGVGCKVKNQQHMVQNDWMRESHSQFCWTEVADMDVITGASEKLERTILSAYERHRPSMIGVLTSSIIEMSGADIAPYVEKINSRAPCPVFHVSTPGFGGDLFQGYSSVSMEVMKLADWSAEPRPARVNIAGYMFDRYELDHVANLSELVRCLQSVKLDAGSVFLSGRETHGLLNAGASGLNVVLPYMHTFSDQIREISNRQTVCAPLPVGIDGAVAWLLETARAAGCDLNRTQSVIRRETKKLKPLMEIAGARLRGRHVVIIADTPLAACLAVMAARLDMVIDAVCLSDRSLGGKSALLDYIRDFAKEIPTDFDVFENPDWYRIKHLFEEDMSRNRDSEKRLFLMHHIDLNEEIARGIKRVEIGIPSCAKHYVYTLPYMGFNGAAALAQRLLDAAMGVH